MTARIRRVAKGALALHEEISRRRIAAAALTIAEADGFDAITMRGLAERLGVSPAAL